MSRRYEIVVKPGSKQPGVECAGQTLVVRVTARAHDGEANRAALQTLAKYLGIPKTRLRIVRGAKSRHKMVEVAE